MTTIILKNCLKCKTEFNAYSKWGEKKYCSKSCANSRGPRTEEFKLKVSKKLIGKKKSKESCEKGWRKRKLKSLGIDINSNLTLEQINELIREALPKCPICEKPSKGKHNVCCSRDCYKIYASQRALKQEKHGGGHKGKYKGIQCDSTWELAYLIYHLDHNISIGRSPNIYSYKHKDKEGKYNPDFIVNGIEIEIKGYLNNRAKAKLAVVPNITVIDKHTIKPYIQYVKFKYQVKDLRDLYDQKTSYDLNCRCCGKQFQAYSESRIYCGRSCSGKNPPTTESIAKMLETTNARRFRCNAID